MAGFIYKALDAKGKTVKSNIEAESQAEAIAKIKAEGMMPLEVTAENLLNKDFEIGIGARKVTARDFCVFCRQMISILSAGVSIVNALNMLAEQTENTTLRKSLQLLAEDVGRGDTLSTAMKKQPNVFPMIFINLIAAGEATGTMEISFERMAIQFEKDSTLEATVKKALTYPIIVCIVAIGVVFVMMIFVIPTFMQMFNDMDIELPAITQFVINLSDFTVAYWWLILIIVFGLSVALKMYAKTESGRVLFSTMSLKIPVLGDVTTKNMSAKFSRTLSTLLKAGVPMIQALEITAGAMEENILFQRAVLGIRDQVSNGTTLSKPVRTCGMYPAMVVHMISIGEETGNLEDLLESVAEYYEEEVANATEQLMTVMEPMIILLLAGIVGVLIMAIMSPMFTLYSALGGDL